MPVPLAKPKPLVKKGVKADASKAMRVGSSISVSGGVKYFQCVYYPMIFVRDTRLLSQM